MSIRQLFLAIGLAVNCWLPAAAQSVPPVTSSISLAQALEAAQNNLDVSLARRALAGAQGDITAADRAPTPVLSTKASSINLQNGIGGGNLFREKRIDKAIGLDWTYERGNKRELRTQAAQRLASAAQEDIEDIKIQQQITAAGAFFDLLAAQERISEVSAIARSAAQLAATAARRVQAGDLAAQDAARTEIEAQRASTDLATAQFDRQRAALVLAQLTGFTGVDMLQTQADWPTRQSLESVPQETFYPSVESRADVRAAVQRLEAARTILDVASAQKTRDITLGTSFDHFPGTSTRQLEFRAQMPLNGFLGSYNYQGEIAKAQAQVNQAEDALEKTRRTATIDYQRLQQDRRGAAARALSYEVTILPRARKVAEMAELAYSKGAMSLTELIDARRTLRSILIEALNARTDHAKAALAWQLRQP
ncbi:MAG: TolC family protein [Polaromonas sp.]|nr:TolC family protein [Polaromonas sp.]